MKRALQLFEILFAAAFVLINAGLALYGAGRWLIAALF